MDPRDAGFGVAAGDARACVRAVVGHRDCKTSGKRSFDDETGHDDLLSIRAKLGRRGGWHQSVLQCAIPGSPRGLARTSPASSPESFIRKSGALPILRRGVPYLSPGKGPDTA